VGKNLSPALGAQGSLLWNRNPEFDFAGMDQSFSSPGRAVSFLKDNSALLPGRLFRFGQDFGSEFYLCSSVSQPKNALQSLIFVRVHPRPDKILGAAGPRCKDQDLRVFSGALSLILTTTFLG
jgi:hypothetical protein